MNFIPVSYKSEWENFVKQHESLNLYDALEEVLHKEWMNAMSSRMPFRKFCVKSGCLHSDFGGLEHIDWRRLAKENPGGKILHSDCWQIQASDCWKCRRKPNWMTMKWSSESKEDGVKNKNEKKKKNSPCLPDWEHYHLEFSTWNIFSANVLRCAELVTSPFVASGQLMQTFR